MVAIYTVTDGVPVTQWDKLVAAPGIFNQHSTSRSMYMCSWCAVMLVTYQCDMANTPCIGITRRSTFDARAA